jgi:hypothetical protein
LLADGSSKTAHYAKHLPSRGFSWKPYPALNILTEKTIPDFLSILNTDRKSGFVYTGITGLLTDVNPAVARGAFC